MNTTKQIADPNFPNVVRTSRGLTVGGRRLTLYLLQDHFQDGWHPKLVKQWFSLSDEEIADVVGYISAHHDEFEQEYRQVLRDAADTRDYWENRNRERMERIKNEPPTPEVAAKRAMLERIRQRRRS